MTATWCVHKKSISSAHRLLAFAVKLSTSNQIFLELVKRNDIDLWESNALQYIIIITLHLWAIRSTHVLVLPSFNHFIVDDSFVPKTIHFFVSQFGKEQSESVLQLAQILF